MIFNTPVGQLGILHPPKCAGGTVKETLLYHFGKDQLIFPTRKLKSLKILKALGFDHYHYTYQQFLILRWILGFKADPKNIVWIVVVRDPIKRLESLYKWKYLTEVNNKNNAEPLNDYFYDYVFNRNFTRKLNTTKSTIPSFLEFISFLHTYCSKTEVTPQSEYIRGIGRDKVYYVRQSSIESDLKDVFFKLGLKYVSQTHVRRHVSTSSELVELGSEQMSKVKREFKSDYVLLKSVNKILNKNQDFVQNNFS